jgi:hypothetical protein
VSSSVSDLVQRLRPEAIRKSANSLSSDVFSVFEEGNPSLEDVHKPVEIVTASLLNDVVPDVTVRLVQGYAADRLPTLGKPVSGYVNSDRCAVLEVVRCCVFACCHWKCPSFCVPRRPLSSACTPTG